MHGRMAETYHAAGGVAWWFCHVAVWLAGVAGWALVRLGSWGSRCGVSTGGGDVNLYVHKESISHMRQRQLVFHAAVDRRVLR
jgi:hypothetical protein